MPDRKKLKQYAALLVDCVNLKEGQELIIRIAAEHAEFGRLLKELAYKEKAGKVTIVFEDEESTRLDYLYADEKKLSRVPESELLRQREEQAREVAYLNVISESADAFRRCDEDKCGRVRQARSRALKPVQDYTLKSQGQWCVGALPNRAWAKQVFPKIKDEDKAVEALYDAIFETVYMNKRGNPRKNWEKHGEILREHCRIMNEYRFAALHFTSGLGTDLLVPLAKGHIWGGGSEKASITGQWFDPNIPTEEIFTAPDCRKTEGKVVASLPLNHDGALIDHFSFEFHKGKVVNYKAAKGKKTLESILKADRGSVRLGEVALVPYDSAVSNTNLLFYNTLFDENAACHLALGACYPTTIEGGESLSDKELLKLGGNSSCMHVDFMFGTEDLSADGILPDGSEVPVFRKGNFVF